MSTPTRTILDHVYDHEAAQADRVFMTQPIGGGQLVEHTWGGAMNEARRMAAHLRSIGVKHGDTVGMLAKNSAHFIIAELAIWMAGGTTVAIFPTETAANVRYVLEHSGARVLFVGKLDEWLSQRPGVPEGVHRIALPLSTVTGLDDAWEAIVARTEPLQGRPARADEDLAMLLYTSGSTGQPKGVMHTFGTVTAGTQGVVDYSIERDGGQKLDHRMLSYLPLSHVFERAWVEAPLLLAGRGHVFFCDTLASFMEDLKRARPTVFVSVPRLWSKFQQGVLAHMPAAQLDAMLADPAMAPAVGKKVLASLGLDAVVRAGSGSAPMPPALLGWYDRIGLPITDGYGMTEDFAYSHSSTVELRGPGRQGIPNPRVRSRIADDGEILIRSPGTMAGYYKQPELTAESFTDDGFFKTGDLGRYDERGLLQLTGRKKEIFKTAKGKYVAPAPIEGRLAAHPMVELALVAGEGQRAAHAMVMLDENLRPKLGDAAVRARVESEMAGLLETVNAAAPSYEHLQFIVVATEPWTMANGCLTPTMKIKRSRIEAGVAQAVAGWYETQAPVVWA